MSLVLVGAGEAPSSDLTLRWFNLLCETGPMFVAFKEEKLQFSSDVNLRFVVYVIINRGRSKCCL